MRTTEPRHVVDVLERCIALRRLAPEPGHDIDTRDRRLRYRLRRPRIDLAEPAGEVVDPEFCLVHQVRSHNSNVGCEEALRANRHVLLLPGQRGSEHDELWAFDERILDVVPRIEVVTV